ncbi:ATP phosphoribosyltransferase regulatory subunit [hydrothermal vent metagenome]|uniref:ATP phosphoribosyltransferase regulatory subunit n=1 Tax=hydrothermal vent metagenome TaxID=652676 RepID=A0A3B1A3T9_9ZZZZ
MSNETWLLPEGIEEVLPPHAAFLEAKRRAILDLYHTWGYELVIPPLIEYLESLLTGTGDDLDLQTFKLTDQLNGRMMGVRADMTPQVARIDAHQLCRKTPTRLCYMGTILLTRPDGFAASRAPLQIGLELYGHSGVESDVEVFQLMVETLRTCGVKDVYFDLGHVGIYRGLVKQAGLTQQQEAILFDALQRKAKPEILNMLSELKIDSAVREMLLALADLNGGEAVLNKMEDVLAAASKDVKQAISELKNIAKAITHRIADVSLHYDLAELRGYHYHTGVVFAAFASGKGSAIAQGGRYDGIGKVFGNTRPATGFSTDLQTLLAFNSEQVVQQAGIFAPASDDELLQQAIAKSRAAGERVIVELPGQTGDGKALACDRQFVKEKNKWQIKPI